MYRKNLLLISKQTKKTSIMINLKDLLTALFLLFGLTSCFQFKNDLYSYRRYFQKENDEEYMICFRREHKYENGKSIYFARLDTTLRYSRVEERMKSEVLAKPLEHKSNVFITRYILLDNLGWTERGEQLDSIGIYQTSNDSLLAMMYPKKIEEEYHLKSSTKYTNPFSEYGWTVNINETEYKKKKGGCVATVTYTLKKLE